MKLLLFTQKVDSKDSVLGFMHGWIERLAGRFEKLTVICLEAGSYSLPENVQVFSLGKEKGISKLGYIKNFYHLVFSLRNQYDAVFAHMNQEYVLLGGIFWKIMAKPVYMWRNHYAGSWLTDMAAVFCRKVFCTSKHSYTAKFKKNVIMPVGASLDIFKPVPNVVRVPRSILFYARMSPSKRPELLAEALGELIKKNVVFTASFIGDPPPDSRKFYEQLKDRVRELEIHPGLLPGRPFSEGPRIFSAHEIFVNLSPSGMYDKTLFEAAACGCLVVALSSDFAKLVDNRLTLKSDKPEELALKLEEILNLSAEEKVRLSKDMILLAKSQSLDNLCKELYSAIIS